MSGAFWGGVFNGGMAVWNQQNADKKLAIEATRADQETKDWQDKQDLKAGLEDANKQQSAATALNAAATSYNAAKPESVVPDSIKIATENINTDDTLSADEKTSQIADSTAGITKAWGGAKGIVPDEVNRFRFGLQRASLLESKGAIKEAEEVRKNATKDAVGAFISANNRGDDHSAAALYNIFPNGHQITSFKTGADGKVAFGDSAGFTATKSKEDLNYSALNLVDPLKAQEYKDNLQLRRETAAATAANHAQLNEIRAAQLLNAGGGRGAGAGAGAAGGSKPNMLETGINGVPGIKDQKEWDEWVTQKTATKDGAPPVMISPTDGKQVQLDPVTYRNEFSSIASGIARANPGIAEGNLAVVAQKVAQAKYVPNPAVKIVPVMNGSTGEIRTIANVDNRDYSMDQQPLNEAQARAAFKANGISDAEADKTIIQSGYVKSARVGGAFADLEAPENSGKRAMAIRTNFGGSEEKYIQARDLAWATANGNKKKWDAYTNQNAQDARLKEQSRAGNPVAGAKPRVTEPVVVDGVTVQPRVLDRVASAVSGAVDSVKATGAEMMNKQRADIVSVVLQNYQKTNKLTPTDADKLAAVLRADPSLEKSIPANIVSAMKFSRK